MKSTPALNIEIHSSRKARLLLAVHLFLLLALSGLMYTSYQAHNKLQVFIGGITAIILLARIISLLQNKKTRLLITDEQIRYSRKDYAFAITRTAVQTIWHSKNTIRIMHGNSYIDEILAGDFSSADWEAIKTHLPQTAVH